MRAIGWVAALCGLIATDIYADVLRVPQDFATLAEAAAAAQAGDEILLGPGEWEGSVEFSSFAVSVRGAGSDLTRIVPNDEVPNAALLRWSAGEASSTPTGGTATLSGLTLDGYRGGDPASQGSYNVLLIVSGDGSQEFFMSDCVLTGCYRPNGSVSALFDLAQVEVRSVVFDEVSGEEGCLYVSDTGTVIVDGCRFVRNGGYGSPLTIIDAQSATLRNSLFTGTSSMFTTLDRAAASIFADVIGIESCSFGLGGPDPVRGGDRYAHLRLTGSQIDIVASAFADEKMFARSPSGAVTFTRCVGLGVPTGNGNIVADPRFVNEGSAGPDGVWRSADDDAGDFTPAPGSPLLDAASGAAFGTTDVDALGNPRLTDLPDVANSGPGALGFLDIGAVERHGEFCPADVNGDGQLNPADFTAWVIEFNRQGSGCDQNQDGLCNPADFNAWVRNFNRGC